MRKPAWAHGAFMSGSFVAILMSFPIRSVTRSLAVSFTTSTLPQGSAIAPGANGRPAIAAVVWQSSGIARPAQSPSTRAVPRRTAASIGLDVLPAPSSNGTIASMRRPTYACSSSTARTIGFATTHCVG
jgi:hypothetical protein